MRLSAVGLRDAGVALDHRHVRVAEQLLQGEQVALVAQIGDGERMPESVRVDVRHPGPLPDADQQPAQYVARQRPWVIPRANGEYRGFRLGVLQPRGQQLPERLRRAFAEVDQPLLLTLAEHFDAVGGHVDVAELDAAQF